MAFSFAATPTQQQPTTGGFGATTTATTFQVPPAAPLFGSSNTQPQLFGGGLGTAPTAGVLTAPDFPAPQYAGVEKSFHELQSAVAEKLRDGRVNHEARAMAMCYDMVAQQPPPQRPPFVRQDLWSAAVAENPDPEHCAAVPVVGFSALRSRVQVAAEACSSNEALVAEIANTADLLKRAAAVSDAETAELRARNDHLVLRLLRVAKKLELLRSAQIPVYQKERSLKASLDELSRNVKSVDSHLDGLSRKFKHASSNNSIGRGGDAQQHHIAQPNEQLQKALKAQTDGLQQLLEVTAKDERDVELLKSALE